MGGEAGCPQLSLPQLAMFLGQGRSGAEEPAWSMCTWRVAQTTTDPPIPTMDHGNKSKSFSCPCSPHAMSSSFPVKSLLPLGEALTQQELTRARLHVLK